MSNNSYLRPFALIFSFFLFSAVSAGSIHGVAKDDAGKSVHLLIKPHLMSTDYQLVESFLISENGEFHIPILDSKYSLYSVLIGDRVAEIVIDNNRDYEVVFPGSKELVFKRANYNHVSLMFRSLPPGDANLVIENFNRLYDQLYKELSFDLASKQSSGTHEYRRSRQGKLDATGLTGDEGNDSLLVSRSFLQEKLKEFKTEVDGLMSTCSNSFAQHYLKYATLQTLIHLEQAEADEIEPAIASMSEVHPEGLALLNTFYKPRMNKVQMGDSYLDFLKSINKYQSSDSLLKVVKSMPFVNSENENLVLLVVLQQAIDHPEIIRRSALKTLYELSISAFPLAGEAKSMLDAYMLGKKGQPLPEFRLVTFSEEFLNHTDFEDEWLYIGFFDSRSSASQVELKMMDELRKKYGRQVKFLAVFIDENSSSVKEFLSGKDFDFDLVFAGGNPTLLQGFKVKSTPEFLLFTPESVLHSGYTRKPSEGIEDDFKRILRNKQRQPIKVWDD